MDDGGVLGERLADVNVRATRAAPGVGHDIWLASSRLLEDPDSFMQIRFSCLGIPERWFEAK